MAKPTHKYYWDACCWIGLINSEADKHRELRLIWERAKRGDCQLFTSAYTFIEVVKAHAGQFDPISIAESDRTIDDLLDQPFVEIIQVDSYVGKLARRLRRTYPTELKQKADAIHLASAIQANMDALHTYDGSGASQRSKLLDLNGKIPRRDGQNLPITMPDADADGPLFGGKKDLSGDSKEPA